MYMLTLMLNHYNNLALGCNSHLGAVWNALSQRAAWWINKHIPDRQIDPVHPILTTKQSGDKIGGLRVMINHLKISSTEKDIF